jgi:hypothetical protein
MILYRLMRDGNGDNTTATRQAPHAQAHKLHFALCVVVRRQQHTTMQAISHRAQVHKLFIWHVIIKTT